SPLARSDGRAEAETPVVVAAAGRAACSPDPRAPAAGGVAGRVWFTKLVTIWVTLAWSLVSWAEVILPLDARLSIAVVSSPTRALITACAVVPLDVATWATVWPDCRSVSRVCSLMPMVVAASWSRLTPRSAFGPPKPPRECAPGEGLVVVVEVVAAATVVAGPVSRVIRKPPTALPRTSPPRAAATAALRRSPNKRPRRADGPESSKDSGTEPSSPGDGVSGRGSSFITSSLLWARQTSVETGRRAAREKMGCGQELTPSMDGLPFDFVTPRRRHRPRREVRVAVGWVAGAPALDNRNPPNAQGQKNHRARRASSSRSWGDGRHRRPASRS